MNYKILLITLLLFSPVFAYTLNDSTFPTTAYVNRDTGFYMKVDNSTVNESRADIDVFVDILDYDGLPYKTICKFEDSENCYLWTTNNIGEVRGVFRLGYDDYIGQEYTLVVTIGDVQQTGTFTLDIEDRVGRGNLPYFAVWVNENIPMFIAVAIMGIALFLIFTRIGAGFSDFKL